MKWTEQEKIEIMERLLEIKQELLKEFPTLDFDEPKIFRKQSISISANVYKSAKSISTVRVFIGNPLKMNVQIELRSNKNFEKQWIKEQFVRLNVEQALRKDFVFLPNSWKHSKMVGNIQEVINRIKILLEIVEIKNKECISPEAKRLLIV